MNRARLRVDAWHVFVALLVLALPIGAAESVDPSAMVDACVARLDTQVDVGYERIAKRCPELAPALERSGWAAWLPQGWKESRNDLSAGSLRELQALATRELATRATAQTPRVEKLKEILADLGTTGQQRSGPWTRFKNWVRSLFERAGSQNREGVLGRFVSRIGLSDAVIQVITYVTLGLVIALACFIVFNELRLAGLFGGARAARDEDAAGDEQGARVRVTWADVERASLLDRPRLMLELIATKLTDLRRLPPAGALTARELAREADLHEADDRERLSQLAAIAERARYAADGVSPETAEAAVTQGRELLTRLESRAAEQPLARGDERSDAAPREQRS